LGTPFHCGRCSASTAGGSTSNNSGCLIERTLEENPNWTYNDLAPWNYAELPKALGCADWYTARVTTLGELGDAMKAACADNTGAYIEIVAGKMDMPPVLAFAMADLAPCTAIRHDTHQTEMRTRANDSARRRNSPRAGATERTANNRCGFVRSSGVCAGAAH
jgi:hypothetical protein